MRLLVLSDTHIPKRAKKLPDKVTEELSKADHIIHAGDFVSMEIVNLLTSYAPLTAVAGNNDGHDIVKRFGYKQMVELHNFGIGVVHGHGKSKTTLQRALDAFKDEMPDLLVFGHSHQPYKGQHGKTLVFNPGSPTDRRRSPQFSYGVIDLGVKIKVKINFFDK